MEPNEPRYRDDEAAQIIKRALEIQKQEDSDGQAHAGLSLSDLEAIGRESGIDPRLIRRAAGELGTRKPVRRSRFLRFLMGKAARHTLTATSPSRADRGVLESLLLALPSLTGDSGNGSIIGQTLTWKSDSLMAMKNGRSISVTVGPTSAGTEIRFQSDISGAAGGLFGGLIGGFGGGGGLGIGLGVGIGELGSTLFSVLVPIGAISLAWLLARTIYGTISRHRRKEDESALELIRRALDLPATQETSPAT